MARSADNTTGPLDAISALRALRALNLRYTPDLTVDDGAWHADCPRCRVRGALRIRELHDRDDDHRNPQVAVGCTRRCAEPSEIAALLATDIDLLEANACCARWRALACWAIDCWQRQLEMSNETRTNYDQLRAA